MFQTFYANLSLFCQVHSPLIFSFQVCVCSLDFYQRKAVPIGSMYGILPLHLLDVYCKCRQIYCSSHGSVMGLIIW